MYLATDSVVDKLRREKIFGQLMFSVHTEWCKPGFNVICWCFDIISVCRKNPCLIKQILVIIIANTNSVYVGSIV